MAALGKILTAADRGSLEMLCKSYSRWLQLENELEAKGMTYYPNGVREIVVGGTTKLVGEARRRPQAALANEYYRQYCSLSAEFGLTPTARARVSTGTMLDDLDL
jgi:P27 family predicted phage terminase small subunit